MPTPSSEVGHLAALLGPRHMAALRWFSERTGSVEPWPDALPDGTLLATKAKGIYKPSWTRYALSVRQTLSSKYADRPLEIHGDDGWTYRYFQEDLDPSVRDSLYTNRGLMACIKDTVPVGVMLQVKGKPDVRYRVLGLGLVKDWAGGHFRIEGPLDL
jgi:putative restriction endonuclease